MRTVCISSVASYVNDKIGMSEFDNSFYISTDSMLKDRGGIIAPDSIPTEGKVTHYKKGDILVSNIRPYFKKIWYATRDGGCSNDVIVFRNNNEIDSRYLYYTLSQDSFFEHVMSGANGTKMPRGNKKLITTFEFPLPDLPTQHRIATILSRYDSLIENYQKQIKLLEEAAQRLYKEWFVDLRFPGHEITTITDGVPEGWEKKKLAEVAEVNKRMISKDYSHSKIEYIDLGSVRLGSIDSPTIYERGQEPGRAKRIASDLDLIWGMVRPNLKAYALVQKPNEQMVFSTGFAVITATKVPSSYLYSYVTTDNFIGYLVNCTNGAAYPAVKPSHFEDADVIVPTSDLLKQYDSIVIKILRKEHYLQSQLRLLTEARDRLLPKLMSGEIEV